MSNETVMQIPIDSIQISPFQPRREFREEELNELADSLKSVGLIQPPVVRAIGSQDRILYYELIAGERRWRAAKKAGFTQLEVIVRNYDDAHAAESTLIENIQRVDLSPIETALAYKRLIDVFGLTQEAVAERVGKKRSTIANYLRLLSLPDETQKSLATGELTMGHAKALLAERDPGKQEVLRKQICEGSLTVREAERASRQKQDDQPEVLELEEQLTHVLQRRVKINHLTNHSGQIVIHYQDLEDLDGLLETLQVGSEPKSVFV